MKRLPSRMVLEFADARRLSWSGLACCVLGAVALAWSASALHQLQAQSERVQDRLAQLERRVKRPQQPSPEALRRMHADAKRLAATGRALNVPWDDLFRALERVRFADVALLSLEPDAAAGTVQITAEARRYPAALEYVQRLAETRLVGEVVLVSHQVVAEAPEKPVRFVVRARWGRE